MLLTHMQQWRALSHRGSHTLVPARPVPNSRNHFCTTSCSAKGLSTEGTVLQNLPLQHNVRHSTGAHASQTSAQPNDSSPVDLNAIARELSQLRQLVQQQSSSISHLQQELESERAKLNEMTISRRMAKEDYDQLPDRIILLRHGESQGNVEENTYAGMPDHQVPLTVRGRCQAREAGRRIRQLVEEATGSQDFKMYFMASPYIRSMQTCEIILGAFEEQQVAGVKQAVQLREQDFGNFQDPERILLDKEDRVKFGRFWYRFPNGESGADVYDRLTIFEDHMSRDMMMGRFRGMNLVLVTHGLTLRVWLMRWFHWTVDEFLEVYNPRNAECVVLEKLPWEDIVTLQNTRYVHVKHMYFMKEDACGEGGVLRGCTPSMVNYLKRIEKVPAMLKAIRSSGAVAHAAAAALPECSTCSLPDDGEELEAASDAAGSISSGATSILAQAAGLRTYHTMDLDATRLPPDTLEFNYDGLSSVDFEGCFEVEPELGNMTSLSALASSDDFWRGGPSGYRGTGSSSSSSSSAGGSNSAAGNSAE